MKKCFLTLTKISIGIGIVLGSLYLATNLWFWHKRDLVWAEVEAHATKYSIAHPEISHKEMQLLTEDLYFEALRRKNLDVGGR